MATIRLVNVPFSPGEMVGLYPGADQFVPSGTLLEQVAVASDVSLTFTVVVPEQRYVAASNASGVWRHFNFTADPAQILPGVPDGSINTQHLADGSVTPAKFMGDASISAKGLTRLSKPPAVVGTPIAVGDNDPRLGTTANVSAAPYNAAGDGVSDDSAAIQAAITAMAAGGTVTGIAGKTYALGTALSLANTTDITLDFTGCTLKIKNGAGAGAGIHAITGATTTVRPTIRGVRIDGNRPGNPGATVGQGIRFASASDVYGLIENCHIFDTIQHGISLSARHFRIARCTFSNTWNAGININSSGEQITVMQCEVLGTASGNTADAISCQGAKCTFVGNRLTSTDTGVNLAGSGHICIGNECFLNGNSGINTGGGIHLVVANCVSYANGRKTNTPRSNAGIRIRDHSTNAVTSNDVIVEGNRCYEDTTTYPLPAGALGQLYGIEIANASGNGVPDNLVIAQNDLRSNLTAAIQDSASGTSVRIWNNLGSTQMKGLSSLIQAGAGITVQHNESLGTFTISGGGDLTAEEVQDLVATFLLGGTGATVVYDDVANTLTINNDPIVFQTQHTFAVGGSLVAGESFPPFFVAEAATAQAVALISARYKTTSGTAGIRLLLNGGEMGYGTTGTPLSVSSTAASATNTVALAPNDEIKLHVPTVSSGVDLSVSLVFQHTLTPA